MSREEQVARLYCPVRRRAVLEQRPRAGNQTNRKRTVQILRALAEHGRHRLRGDFVLACAGTGRFPRRLQALHSDIRHLPDDLDFRRTLGGLLRQIVVGRIDNPVFRDEGPYPRRQLIRKGVLADKADAAGEGKRRDGLPEMTQQPVRVGRDRPRGPVIPHPCHPRTALHGFHAEQGVRPQNRLAFAGKQEKAVADVAVEVGDPPKVTALLGRGEKKQGREFQPLHQGPEARSSGPRTRPSRRADRATFPGIPNQRAGCREGSRQPP